jgi:hypothetical protein
VSAERVCFAWLTCLPRITPPPPTRRPHSGMADASGEWRWFVVDASAEGCSGMFWRTRPDMGATASDPSWPRNGTRVEGK